MKARTKRNLIIYYTILCTLGTVKFNRIVRKNPYFFDEILQTIENGQDYPDELSDEINAIYDKLIEEFPQYKDLIIKRKKNLKIIATDYDKYERNPITSSFYIDINDHIILNKKQIKSLSHEIIHQISGLKNIEATGFYDFESNSNIGYGLNEGMTTLIDSEVISEDPSQQINDYCIELMSARLITNILGKDFMIEVFFDSNKNINDIMNELSIYFDSNKEVREYIKSIDKATDALKEYANVYFLKDIYDIDEVTVENAYNKFRDSYILPLSYNYKLATNYIKRLEKEGVNKYKIWDEIKWMDSQFNFAENQVYINLEEDSNYKEYMELREFYFKSYILSNYESVTYKYKGLIVESKTEIEVPKKKVYQYNN